MGKSGGKANGHNLSTTPQSINAIELGELEKEEIRKLDQNIGVIKIRLADLQLQIMMLNRQLLLAAQEFGVAQDNLLKVVVESARSHGIETGETSKEKWNLNISDGIFTRIS